MLSRCSLIQSYNMLTYLCHIISSNTKYESMDQQWENSWRLAGNTVVRFHWVDARLVHEEVNNNAPWVVWVCCLLPLNHIITCISWSVWAVGSKVVLLWSEAARFQICHRFGRSFVFLKLVFRLLVAASLLVLLAEPWALCSRSSSSLCCRMLLLF